MKRKNDLKIFKQAVRYKHLQVDKSIRLALTYKTSARRIEKICVTVKI